MALEMGQGRKFRSVLLPPLGMLLTQLIMTGMLVLSKIVFDRGAFVYSFLAYRCIIAALCVAPFAFFLEREMLNKLSWPAAIWIFVNAITGITIGIGFYYYGLRDTTATFSSCFYNLIPIVTFVLAVLLRIEELKLNTAAGKAKVVGAAVCVGGGMLVTLYKGKILHHGSAPNPSWKEGKATVRHRWGRGAFFLIGSCLSDALWYLGQVKLFTVFPSKYWATAVTCGVGSLQSLVVGLLLNREKWAWKIEWDLQLLTTVYSGALTTGVLFCLTTWIATMKGPTYPAIFNSLSLIFIAVVETFSMEQDFSLGSLLGIILIIGGLSAFLWGKGRGTSTTTTSSLKEEEKKPQQV